MSQSRRAWRLVFSVSSSTAISFSVRCSRVRYSVFGWRPVSTGRQPNTEYRTREHLTEKEMAVLLDTLKTNRHALRDWLIGRMIYRHGLRVQKPVISAG